MKPVPAVLIALLFAIGDCRASQVATNLTVTLFNGLTGDIHKLAANSRRTWSFNPSAPGLGSNRRVWTWPVNLSCVGYASDGYQATLIASNKLLTCNHYGGESGQSVQFYDTNGVSFVGHVAKVLNVLGDMDIAILSNSAPASIVIPYVFPPDYINHRSLPTLFLVPCVWLHKNTGQIQYEVVEGCGYRSLTGGAANEVLDLDSPCVPWSSFSCGTGATGGDSGSPAFAVLDGSQTPILLFAATLPTPSGAFVSGEHDWAALAALGLTNGFNILNLSAYP